MLKQLSYPITNEHFHSLESVFSNGHLKSSLLSKGVSLLASFIGSLQPSVTRIIAKRFLGSSSSAADVDAGCSHLLKYHTMHNVLFVAKTKFLKLHEEPDWNFMRAKQDQIAFLFGVDDH